MPVVPPCTSGPGGGRPDDFQTVKRFQWAMAPLPQGPAGRANFFHLSMFAIARNSQHSQAAWEFLQYMLSKKGIETTIGNAQGVPSIPTLLTDPAFSSSPIVKGHDTVKPMLESLPTAHRAPNIVAFNEFQDKLDAALDPVWAGKQDPRQPWMLFASRCHRCSKAGERREPRTRMVAVMGGRWQRYPK